MLRMVVLLLNNLVPLRGGPASPVCPLLRWVAEDDNGEDTGRREDLRDAEQAQQRRGPSECACAGDIPGTAAAFPSEANANFSIRPPEPPP